MGGTFDHLHEGHKSLIKTALSISNNIVIGLTTEKLLKNKKAASKLENYETRKRNLEDFIKTIADITRVQIIELNDIYGPPINEPEYDGIFVSQETYKVAVKINEIRESNGFKPLIIIVISIIKDENNQKISSTSIREKLL
ncbi:MAG: pantetheine-phosphate adenylyltransferase [Candidatus Lokiarchaeota archaeon]|nr:pantetheine-phosphate adenylyltransferase [Candidatus Lokiarchaeota archaeon]